MEFHHPPNSPSILAAIPESQDRHTGSSRSIVVSFFIGFWYLVGLVFHRFSRSIINQFRHWHWRDVTIECIFSFSTDISPTVGEEGEDEEDEEEERLSCFIGVRKDDEDVEEELVKPGTTIGTKFSVLEIIRIPSLMRCGF